MNCKPQKIEAIYYINPKDVKSYQPFTLKRKYGKFKRIVHVKKFDQ